MTEFATSAAPPRGGMKFKHILLLALIAFGGGIGASWWLADSYGWLGSVAPMPSAGPAASKVAASSPPAATLVAPLTATAVDSAMAAGNAARAEGLLVAIAARRAIDNGTPLGYLTDQLRLRFGSSQSEAVIAIRIKKTSDSIAHRLKAFIGLIVFNKRIKSRTKTYL